MPLTTLKDDLLTEFREERVMINEQIALLDPLATSLRKPAAQRLVSSSTLALTEYICYIISLGGVACICFLHIIQPFSCLYDLFYNPGIRNTIGGPNLMYLTLGVYSLAAISVTLTFILGRVAREMRLKNEILYHAGKDIKTIVGQHLERKAALDTIEQRHMLGTSGIQQPDKQKAAINVPAANTPFMASLSGSVNEFRNPGFE